MTQNSHQEPREIGVCTMAQGWAAADLDREIARVRRARPLTWRSSAARLRRLCVGMLGDRSIAGVKLVDA